MLFFCIIQLFLCLICGISSSSSFHYYGNNETIVPDDSLTTNTYYLTTSHNNNVYKSSPISSVKYKFPPISPSFSIYGHQNPLFFSNSVAFKNKDETFTTNPIVWINDGGLKGFTMKTILGNKILGFQSIPFAKPPIGSLRFKAPLKNLPWTGVRDAISESPACLQTDFIRQYAVIGSEDCLYLNVYTPKIPKYGERSNLAVMVFIHGGGFFFGSSNLYGPSYLLDENVVLVSMNYRLGPLGFLTTGDEVSPGNNGLKDQTLALKWIQENIHAFGGDPSKVTIFGESAGAGSVQLHMVSSLSRGLFHAGISQSGSAFCSWSVDKNGVELGKTFSKSFNCTTANSVAMMECLHGIDGGELVKGQQKLLKWNIYPVRVFGPVIEPRHKGAFLCDSPKNIYKRGGMANVPWLTGYNSNEGGLNIATVLLNPIHAKNINDEWDRVGPIIMDMEDVGITNYKNINKNNSIKLLRSIRKYYLGSRDISFDNRIDSCNMFADRYLYICGVKSIQYHAYMSSKPVYAYHFNYVGSYSIVQLIGQNPKHWGPAHLDELIYLMNNTLYYPDLRKTDEEYKVSRIMTNLWSNFAKTGRPILTVPNIGVRPDIWEPVNAYRSNIQFLDISLQPKMINDPFFDRLNFWNSLNLNET